MDSVAEFSLGNAFRWDEPISEPVQVSISAYGSDEDRLLLVEHASVTPESLERMSLVPSAEVRLAVANHPLTPPEALALLTHDHQRFVRAAAKRAIAQLTTPPSDAAPAAESAMQRIRARLSA